MSFRPSVQAAVTGAGTNYTLTTSYARVDFGTTDPEIVLPTAGTYLIVGNFQFISDALSANDLHGGILRNSTDNTFIGHGAAVSLGASFYGYVQACFITTIAASKTIQLWAANFSAARGVVDSINTSIRYIRLY